MFKVARTVCNNRTGGTTGGIAASVKLLSCTDGVWEAGTDRGIHIPKPAHDHWWLLGLLRPPSVYALGWSGGKPFTSSGYVGKVPSPKPPFAQAMACLADIPCPFSRSWSAKASMLSPGGGLHPRSRLACLLILPTSLPKKVQLACRLIAGAMPSFKAVGKRCGSISASSLSTSHLVSLK